MAEASSKPIRCSLTTMTEIIQPSDSNPVGNAFGGRIMAWIDACASICAQRHCRSEVVTASIDALHFLAPMKIGEIACFRARVNAAFSHSLEVEVSVDSEVPKSGKQRHCCSALLTFVALSETGRPIRVPALITETDEEKARAETARTRRSTRLQTRLALKHPSGSSGSPKNGLHGSAKHALSPKDGPKAPF